MLVSTTLSLSNSNIYFHTLGVLDTNDALDTSPKTGF